MQVCPFVIIGTEGSDIRPDAVFIETKIKIGRSNGMPRDSLSGGPTVLSELIRICKACPINQDEIGLCNGWVMDNDGSLRLPELLDEKTETINFMLGMIRSGGLQVRVEECSQTKRLLRRILQIIMFS